MTEETIPQRVRRLGREYAKHFFPDWNASRRGAIQFAWEKGYWASRNEIIDDLERLDAGVANDDIAAVVQAAHFLLDKYLPIEWREDAA
ncbi:hypothetical protein [Streptomyces sp. AC495_CC817]|uniref:hypothetical protein n=1 Tax=Streptomyces sp. AC495_CC817 TaxID=2823900 RepID=UPI001C25DC28|nr:hypothetical protein [Streptomyces sp. AC495_CC817]